MSQKYNGNDIFAPFNGGLYDIDAYDTDRSMQYEESKESIVHAFKSEYEDIIRGTHAYVCEECPFIAFEYYTDKDYENLRALIK